MEAIAFLEILGRDGRVVVRQPVHSFPCRIGRAYDNDLILDDPYVAAHHAALEEVEAGRYAVRDLGSRNGLMLLSRRRRMESAEIGPEDVIRLGHTQLRVRPHDYAVPKELDARRQSWARHPAGCLAVWLAALAVVGGIYYQGSSEDVEPFWLVGTLLAVAVGALLWSAGWAFATRLVTGQWSYLGHATTAGAALLALLAADELVGGLTFALGAPRLRLWDSLPLGLVFAAQCYRHLRLVSRAPRRRLATAALLVALVCFGAPELLNWLSERENVGKMNFLTDIRPPGWRLVAGVTPQAFIGRIEALRGAVDASSQNP